MKQCLGQGSELRARSKCSGMPRTPGSARIGNQLSSRRSSHPFKANRDILLSVRTAVAKDSRPETSVDPQRDAAATAAQEKEASQDVDSLMAAKINAVAGKINAARELARRLAEEKNAANKPLASPKDVHAAEAASAAAAAQAARADSLARALRKAEQTNDQLRRLKAENEALRDLLLEQAPDRGAAMARLNQVGVHHNHYRNQQQQRQQQQ
ncbi:hypothetical protein DUNSADRAFT_4926 [Dunaliella salina]|uniref:Uncharacterized protein n=1 Tax=Dunaliella salina TaxID=3046 RepID=A0ABQ7GR13_DUNSA|nr:hypothetical protein DUNSADRAFT_4926 [Dunaliella salina]|eukprot:KAF5837046.1 hypothetical protein DUNSADRAFT_4926 [Dunaliella salina]